MQEIEQEPSAEERPATGQPVAEPKPPIVTTPYDALELVFDYISLEDLCAIGMTCKRLQQMAGQYFRLYYPQEYIHISVEEKQRESVQETNTNLARYAERISFILVFEPDEYEMKWWRHVEQWRYLEQLGNKKLKFIELMGPLENPPPDQWLAKVLKSVENVTYDKKRGAGVDTCFVILPKFKKFKSMDR